MGNVNDWVDTDLWAQIQKRGADSRAYLVLRNAMPLVQDTLRVGVPSSPDFTLHDNEHGFRVAQLAARLLEFGPLRTLSDIELALLLLASYCHDIGMSPVREKVVRHHNYLITGDTNLLKPAEAQALQSWLDATRDGITPPIEPGQLTADGLVLVDEINAYYARSRHNDWSEEWIRSELNKDTFTLYPGWIEDLVTLCRSHHEGIAQLRQPRFDARLVGSPSVALNLRYLAAVLRVADVMEFAPERTPEVVLRQRSIAAGSRIFWYKDHSIAFRLVSEKFQVFFTALTPSAAIHRAVLDTAEWTDRELATCSALEQEGAFRQGTIPGEDRQKYDWPWAPRLTRDIRERDGAFVYIDGAFRPDHKKILELLSGTALYRQRIVAARELIQNAIDAVKEQIAYERLKSRDPTDENIADAFGSVHTIRISLAEDAGEIWLRCEDDGSGMTKAIIENSLLVSGSGVRGDLRTLERDAKSAGFSVGRTGQFGIGVLSYFMLADKFVVLTRRSGDAGDPDGRAWQFSSEGVGSFGELREASRSARGTEVSLRIRPDVLGDNPTSWFKEVVDYLLDVVRISPCRIEFYDAISDHGYGAIGPGWTRPKEKIESEYLAPFRKVSFAYGGVLISRDEAKLNDLRKSTSARYARAAGALRWVGPQDFVGGLGAYRGRLWLPFFALPGGASSVFLDTDSRHTIHDTSRGVVYQGAFARHTSWHGILVGRLDESVAGCTVETDHIAGKSISVDRQSFVEEGASSSGEEARRTAAQMWRDFLTLNKKSLYNELNVLCAPLPSSEKAGLVRRQPVWPIREGLASSKRVRKLIFPLFSVVRTSFYVDDRQRFSWNDMPINEAGWLNEPSGYKPETLLNLFGGGAIVSYRLDWSHGGLVGVRWMSSQELVPLDGSISAASSLFPPEWASIVVIVSPGRLIFNKDHPIIKNYLGKQIPNTAPLDLSSVEKSLAQGSKSHGAAIEFILSNARHEPKFWVYLREKCQKELAAVVAQAGISASGAAQILYAPVIHKIQMVDLFSIPVQPGAGRTFPLPPRPGPEWNLVEVPEQDQVG